jgi:hypothetical protein
LGVGEEAEIGGKLSSVLVPRLEAFDTEIQNGSQAEGNKANGIRLTAPRVARIWRPVKRLN